MNSFLVHHTKSAHIENAIIHRLGMERMARLIGRYGMDIVDMELSMTASFYAGGEEIGTSDVSYMCDTFLRGLGEPSYFQEVA